tara:strand:- start:800 stop:1108 length:309 start_codon:yes stop_codon:yes gene_type:complete
MNIMPSSRSRKSMYEQLSAMEYAAKRLINSRGKHKRQYGLMNPELQNQFKTLSLLVANLQSDYEKFLFETAKDDEDLAKRFMPEFLHERIPVVLAAKDCTLV